VCGLWSDELLWLGFENRIVPALSQGDCGGRACVHSVATMSQGGVYESSISGPLGSSVAPIPSHLSSFLLVQQ
jgi:hypothetical protein